MKDPVSLMLAARNKYVLVACNRLFQNLETILTNNDDHLRYREIYNTKEDVARLVMALKKAYQMFEKYIITK